jgi:hypothetical protein
MWMFGLAAVVASAADVSVPWQGHLVDASGNPVDGVHTVEITLYDGTTPVWRKSHAAVPFQGGFVSLTLQGTDDLASTPLDSALFAKDLLVGVRLDSGSELSPRMSIGSTPRAASVRGTVIVDDLPVSCTSELEGAIRWNGSTFEGCTPSGWTSIGAQSLGTASNPALDCQDLHEAEPTKGTNVYWIDPDGAGTGAPFQAYCDMTTSGGGWTLLLTLTHQRDQYAGSVSPFTQNLNVTAPSPSSAYSRNWTGTFSPLPGHELLLKRADGQFVRFVQGAAFCGWGNTAVCNGVDPSGHVAHTQGQLFDAAGASIDRIAYFGTCAIAGSCGSTGVDGPGFSDFSGWPQGGAGSRAYGAGWSGSVGEFYWGTTGVPVNAQAPMTYWYRRGTPSVVANGQRPDTAATSCKAIKLVAPSLSSGVYWIDPDGGGSGQPFPARCDMVTNGGGWTLLLTLTHPRDQYTGSVSPFSVALNPLQPSEAAGYSRDWRNVVNPVVGTEFLAKRADGVWVRFVENAAFCGWANTATCNGVATSGHVHYTQGQLYNDAGAAISGHVYFNACAVAGGCGAASDAPGFSNNPPWPQAGTATSAYGASWSDAGVSNFYWGTAITASTPMTYWVR